jgi:signal transduction histidine kinase
MIRKCLTSDGGLDRLRPIGFLLVASIAAPLINTLLIPAYFCLQQIMPWSEYGRALSQWNLSNGAGMLMGTSFILSLVRGNWKARSQWREGLGLAAVAVLICAIAFDGLFSGAGFNFAFIVFPVVIYAAVRFAVEEVSAVFAIALVAIFVAAARHAHAIPPAEMATTIWFVQAFCWVLAATGLVVVALVSERRRAETLTSVEKNRALEASVREDRARLDALRYQINPHFLFNSLNAVRAEIPLEQPVAREMLTGLADYLRSTLDRPDTDVATLREELGSTEGYLAIERRRFNERLRLSVEVHPATLDVKVPVFLLQPLVENAIRHGLEASKGPCDLQIKATMEEDLLRIEVANTGPWKDEGGRKGLGLENIRRRLELLYGPAARLTRIAEEGWVRFQVIVPVKGAPAPHALPDR